MTSENTREVVRCVECKLVQFWTNDGKCRRPGCNRALQKQEPVVEQQQIIVVESVVPLPKANPQTQIECLGENIRFIRKSMGMSAVALAVNVPTRSSYISRIENGVMLPSIGMLEKISLALGVSVPDVLYPDSMGWVLRDRFVCTVAVDCMRKLADRQRKLVLESMADLWTNAQRNARSRAHRRGNGTGTAIGSTEQRAQV